jgi:hypothetical protein
MPTRGIRQAMINNVKINRIERTIESKCLKGRAGIKTP